MIADTLTALGVYGLIAALFAISALLLRSDK